jgi:putative transposase
MNANQAAFPVRTMCRVLDVSPSGFYDWLGHVPSQRKLDDAVLLHHDSAGMPPPRVEHGLPTVAARVASAAPPVDNPAGELIRAPSPA